MSVNYQYRRNREYDSIAKIGKKWRVRCFSKRALKKRHPKGAEHIVGAIGTGLTEPMGQFLYGNEECFYYNQKQSGMRYRIVGYMEVEEGQYFAIMKKSRRKPLMILTTLLLILAVAAAFLWSRYDGVGILDDNAMDFTPPDHINIKKNENTIAIPGYSEIYVAEGTNYANVVLWNPDSNPCYFEFIMTDEEGEVLYQSNLVPPGKAIQSIEFSKNIPQGEHKITIEVKSYSLTDRKMPLNGGIIECKLIGIAP